MPKTWVLYDKKDWQVKWPSCVNNLLPVKNKNPFKEPYLPKLKEAFSHNETLDEILASIQFFSILGTCRTHQYLRCPNIPAHHLENSHCGPRIYLESKEEYWRRRRNEIVNYFNDTGRYYWVDFDVIPQKEGLMKLRMALNEGDADCNDGFWGEVWQRNTGKKIGDIRSTGDMETTVSTCSRELDHIIELITRVVIFCSWR